MKRGKNLSRQKESEEANMPKTKIVEITEKFTKKDNFMELRECVAEHADWFADGVADRLIEFIDHEVELLGKRSTSAKKYAEKHANKDKDEMATNLMDVLMDAEGLMTIPQIVAKMNPELNATPQKLTYRLTAMVKSGDVHKELVAVKEEGKPSRKVNAYRLATDADVATDAE